MQETLTHCRFLRPSKHQSCDAEARSRKFETRQTPRNSLLCRAPSRLRCSSSPLWGGGGAGHGRKRKQVAKKRRKHADRSCKAYGNDDPINMKHPSQPACIRLIYQINPQLWQFRRFCGVGAEVEKEKEKEKDDARRADESATQIQRARLPSTQRKM